MNSNQSWNDDLADAEVYVGDTLCGTLPSNPGPHEYLDVECDVTGNFVKIQLVE